MEWTYDIPYKNLHFVTTENKSDGVFAEIQIMSYILIFLKHIQVSSQFQKILMLKIRLSFLGTICKHESLSFYNVNSSSINVINSNNST